MQQPRAVIVTAIVLALCLTALTGQVAAQDTVTYAFAHRIYQHFSDGSSINVNGIDAIEVPTGRLAARLELPGRVGYNTEPFTSPDQRWLYIIGLEGLAVVDARALTVTYHPIAGAVGLLKGFVSTDGSTLFLVEGSRILHVDAATFDVLRAVDLPVSAGIEELNVMPRGANIRMNGDRTRLYYLGISGYYAYWMVGVDVQTGTVIGQTPTVQLMSARMLTNFELLPDESAAWSLNLWDPIRWIDLTTFQWITADRPSFPYVTGVAWLDATRAFFGYIGNNSRNACGVFDTTTGVRLSNLPCNALSGQIKGSFTRDGQYLAMMNAAHPREWQPVMFFDTETWTSRWSDTHWFDSSYDGWIVTATVALDTTPPEVNPIVTGTKGAGEWYTSDVAVTWTAADPESDVTARRGCDAITISADTNGTTLTCTATSTGGTSTRSVTIARDTLPPAINTPDAVGPIEAEGSSGTIVNYAASAADTGSGLATFACAPASGSRFALGKTPVRCEAADRAGNRGVRNFVVEVRDTKPPVIGTVRVGPDALWPPNHQMVNVTAAVSATDTIDPAPACRIAKVSSSEAIDGLGDGDTAPDWFHPDGLLVALRAERAGGGAGRTYTLTLTCTDSSGNVATTTAAVSVPKSQGKR